MNRSRDRLRARLPPLARHHTSIFFLSPSARSGSRAYKSRLRSRSATRVSKSENCSRSLAYFVEASSAWAFGSKWHRAFVGAAGMYVELAVAALATLVWAATSPGVVHALAYNVIFIASVTELEQENEKPDRPTRGDLDDADLVK